MRTFAPSETALLLIDIQRGFDHATHWGTTRSTRAFETNIELLLRAFRKAEAPVFHVCHHSTFDTSPLHPSKESSGFMPYATPLPSEHVFPKSTNSPFVQTNLKEVIQQHQVKRLVVAGLMTAHCVSTTIRMASNLDVVDHDYGIPNSSNKSRHTLVLVSDGTATFDVTYEGRYYDAETVHAIHLATVKDEFCDIETTNEVIAALERDTRNGE